MRECGGAREGDDQRQEARQSGRVKSRKRNGVRGKAARRYTVKDTEGNYLFPPLSILVGRKTLGEKEEEKGMQT